MSRVLTNGTVVSVAVSGMRVTSLRGGVGIYFSAWSRVNRRGLGSKARGSPGVVEVHTSRVSYLWVLTGMKYGVHQMEEPSQHIASMMDGWDA